MFLRNPFLFCSDLSSLIVVVTDHASYEGNLFLALSKPAQTPQAFSGVGSIVFIFMMCVWGHIYDVCLGKDLIRVQHPGFELGPISPHTRSVFR